MPILVGYESASPPTIHLDNTVVSWGLNNPTAGQSVLLTVWSSSSETITSVVDNGSTPSTFTRDVTLTFSSRFVSIYRADNITLPATGSYQVTISTGAQGHHIEAEGVAVWGIKRGGPTTTNTASGTGTAVSSGSVTAGAAGALYLAGFFDASTLTTQTSGLTTGSTFTDLGINHAASLYTPGGSAYKIDSGGPTATAASWTLGDSVAWGGVIAVYDADTVTVSTSSLPSGTIGTPYSQTLAATGGVTPYSWSVSSGNLPPGLTLSSAGVISGTPTTGETAAFTVKATDAINGTGTKALTIAIAYSGNSIYQSTYTATYQSSSTPAYVTNYCPNPSFEVSLAGYTAMSGSTIAQDNQWALAGQQSMLVTTDGLATSEGFTGPQVPAGTTTTAAVSFSILSSTAATFTVDAVDGNGNILASTLVNVTPGLPWQRVILQNFAVAAGSTFGLLVATNSPEALQFWVDAVQYELGVTAASIYIDGNSTGASWSGAPGLSTSVQFYQNPTSASGAMVMGGRATPVQVGEKFSTSASGSMRMSGDANASAALPTPTFTDFAIFELGDPDPAMTYVDQNNAGTTTPTTGTLFYDFESSGDLSNFGESSGTLAQSTAWSRTGTHSMLWTTTNTANSSLYGPSPTVVPGDFVNVSWWVNCAQAEQLELLIDWYNGGTYLSTVHGGKVNFAPNTPAQLTISGAKAPASTTAAHIYLGVTAPNTGDLIYSDDFYASYCHYLTSYGVFYPPLDYPVSGNKYLWNRAAYMGVGFYFTGVPAAQEQLLTDFQVTLSPLATTPVPDAYTPPRQIATIIKPTRLNFCPNPSFEVDTSGWSAVGSATLAQDTIVPPTTYETMQQLALGPWFNNNGITTDGVGGTGDFGDGSNTYSANQLALAGLGVGVQVQSGGIEFVMPAVGAGTPDNVMCLGQTIPLSSGPGASVIGFMGAAVSGGMTGLSGDITITYSDGSTDTVLLGFSDWTLDAGAATPAFGNQIVGDIPYRNSGNTSQTVITYIFSANLPVNSAKTPVSVTLPNVQNMHIFGITLAEAVGTTFGSKSCKATITATAAGLEINIPDLIVGDTYTVSYYTEVAKGIAAITTSLLGGTIITGGALSNQTNIGGVPYGGTPGIGYGQGYYGGVSGSGAGTDVTPGVWYRIAASFVASESTVTLIINAATGSDFSSSSNFWVDAVLVETGEIVGSYFDGSYGSSGYQDYQWESTAGKSRSYYYEQYAVKKFSIAQLLEQHTPLGLDYAAPIYVQPYTQ